MTPSPHPTPPTTSRRGLAVAAVAAFATLAAMVQPPAVSATPDPLLDAVARAVGHDEGLPGPDGGACDPADVRISWDPVPEEDLVAGGYMEPLVRPEDGDGASATGIALCGDDTSVVTGFDAMLEDGAWTVYALPVDHHHEDHELHDAIAGGPTDSATASTKDVTAEALVGTPPDEGLAPALQSASSQVPVPGWPAGLSSTPDALASYDGQDQCLSTVQPGTRALGDLITAVYPSQPSWYSLRDCGVGGRSEHKEGRALDWFVDAYDPAELEIGDRFARWLTDQPDPWGHAHGPARRMGVMYVIWNRETWSSYNADAGWRTYTGSSPHTDHIHISLSWDGADCQTTWWQASDCAGDATTTTTTGDVQRIVGSADTSTSAQISRAAFSRAETVVVARVDKFPDALAASALAAVVDGPVLLTQSGYLPYSIATEISRLGATKAYVIGGENAVSANTESQLGAYTTSVERLGGANRFETAIAIQREVSSLVGDSSRVILARSDTFPDALASATLAAEAQAPILLTKTSSLPSATAAALRDVDPSRVWVLGGQQAISAGVAQDVRDLGIATTRLEGETRYETALAIAALAEDWGADSEPTVLATGSTFAHALAGGPAAVGMGGQILLARPNGASANGALLNHLEQRAGTVDTVLIVGDGDTIDTSLDDAVRDAIR